MNEKVKKTSKIPSVNVIGGRFKVKGIPAVRVVIVWVLSIVV